MLTARNEPGHSFIHGRSQVLPTRKESGLAMTRLGIAKSAGLPVNFQIACHPLAEGSGCVICSEFLPLPSRPSEKLGGD